MQALIVDKSTISIKTLKDLLTDNGYEVITASNGEEGLKVLNKNPLCQLVISEWHLPEMNGIEFCKAVRAQYHLRYVYFMFLTSHCTSNEMLQCFTAGADDFVSKPYDPAEIIARLTAGTRVLNTLRVVCQDCPLVTDLRPPL